MTQVPAAGVPLTFKIASEAMELEQVHRLNYRTFVDEIPQHAPNSDRLLVDKFDHDNTYVVCRRGDQVVGMLALRVRRPFSLDAKLENLDRYLPPHRAVCEFRLLAVEPEFRTGVVFRGLIGEMRDHATRAGFDLAVISATVRQLKLYRHMGFVPFGPLVGTEDAPYQPMYLTRQEFEGKTEPALRARTGASPRDPVTNGPPGNFLPGPVVVHPSVTAAFARPAVSHRHPDFARDLAATHDSLRALTGARHVHVLVGSGTLANDTVAAHLSLLASPGVVLSNGEFGERLADQARRARLPHSVVRSDWGELLDLGAVDRALAALPAGGWCWMVHCETSSGVLNEIDRVRELCASHSIRLSVDCVSSIGTVPVDLSGVQFASCVSGKALAGMSGLSMVLYNEVVKPDDRLPRYFDIGYAAERGGVPFTQSSNLFAALRVAVERTTQRAPFDDVARLGRWMRAELRERGFSIVAPESHAAPAIVTLSIPGNGNGPRLRRSPCGGRVRTQLPQRLPAAA